MPMPDQTSHGQAATSPLPLSLIDTQGGAHLQCRAGREGCRDTKKTTNTNQLCMLRRLSRCVLRHLNRERGGFERFYAGAPLVAANGHRLGTLCLGGSQPKEIDAHEVVP